MIKYSSVVNENNHIIINLNDMQYRYDVYQMINLFFYLKDISFNSTGYDYKINITKESITIFDGTEEKRFIISNCASIKGEIRKVIFKYFSMKTGIELPWGTLIGIRPSKRAMAMLEEGKNEEEIINVFKNDSYTREDKAKLCIEVAKREKEFINKEEKNISIYVGMPFCPTRCLYCSFASNPIGKYKAVVQSYLEALKHEIEVINKYINEKNLNIECVYFGGGTPTAVNDNQFDNIMEEVYKKFVMDRHIKEFTVECGRPDSITYNKLCTMKKYEVDRISINPQSMNDETLKLIGRNHSSKEVIDIFKMAKELGFDNINMDIIVGLPGEKLKNIEKTCSELYKLNPDSITVHGMSIKRASRLYENILNNIEYEIPSQQELNEMFEKTVKLCDKLDMKPYYMYRQKNMVGNMENIGYTRKGKECIYNIEMIEDKQTIIALGADGVTKVVFGNSNRIERFGNIKDVREYIDRLDEKLEKKIELLDTFYLKE